MSTLDDLYAACRDSPFALAKLCWPHVRFYREQREIIQSVEDNDETYVVAANEMGKDFVAGFICLSTFLRHEEVRVVTTSVKDDHLRVLWGEIGRFIDTSVVPLDSKKGGPLLVNHREVRKLRRDGPNGGYSTVLKIPYLIGQVSERGEGLAGHHASRTLAVIDEATGVDEVSYTQMSTWADKFLIFGNANSTPKTHFFRRACIAGDLLAE